MIVMTNSSCEYLYFNKRQLHSKSKKITLTSRKCLSGRLFVSFFCQKEFRGLKLFSDEKFVHLVMIVSEANRPGKACSDCVIHNFIR